jgi:ABC-type multidrug transport system fused ATPase/permease subunit
VKKNASDHFGFLDIPRAIWYFVAEDRSQYVFFTFLLFIALFYVMVPPYLIGSIVDFLAAYKTGESLKPLYIYIIILAISGALIAVIRLSSKKMLGRISINARYRAKVWGFSRLLDFSLSWHQQENTGNKAQRIITGSEAIREWSNNIANKIFPTITAFIGSLIACLILNPWFSLFFIYYLGILLLTEIIFDRKISKLSDMINKSMENASGTFVESASNILAVKALGAKKSMSSSIAAREQLARELSHKRLSLGNAKWICFQIHNSLAWGVYVFLIAYAVLHGLLTVGLVLTYTSYFASLREAATTFTDNLQNMIEMKSNLGRMMPYFWSDHQLKTGDKLFPADWTSIQINDVSFKYKDSFAVKNFNMIIRRGEKIGIAGHSGSGKSTLIKLILGLYHPEAGEIIIENIPIQQIKHDNLIMHLSVVLQETELFNLSLRDNITMMRELDHQLLEKVCTIACLDDLIERLPQGLLTLIGERGYSLSGGERQRVGIARALYKNTPLLLLDEATSALDSTTEKKIMDGLLGEHTKDTTMLIVAHRISTLRNTDRIVVFDKGEIAEEGAFNELCGDETSRFGSMYALQSANGDTAESP